MATRMMGILAGAVATLAIAVTVYAAGGSKRTAEVCNDDNECSRGHCHTKQDGKKVYVDCSSSEISDYFKVRIANGDRCIKARDDENRRCRDGADQGHKDALNDAEKVRKVCYDELSTRNGNGGIYTCSDSTYSSRATDTDTACSGYGRGCEAWSKDDKVVGCSEIEGDQSFLCEATQTYGVTADRATSIGVNDTLIVGTKLLMQQAATNITLEGDSCTIQSPVKITLVVGGSSITIEPSIITITSATAQIAGGNATINLTHGLAVMTNSESGVELNGSAATLAAGAGATVSGATVNVTATGDVAVNGSTVKLNG